MGHSCKSHDPMAETTLARQYSYLYVHHDSLAGLIETNFQPSWLFLLSGGCHLLLQLFGWRLEMWCNFCAIAILKRGRDS